MNSKSQALLKALLSQQHRIRITEGQRRAILARLERSHVASRLRA